MVADMIPERRKKTFWGNLVSSNNRLSSMRWIFVVTFCAVNILFWGAWLVLTIINGTMQDVPEGLVWAYTGVLSVVTGGKVVQSFSPSERVNYEGIGPENLSG
jgi:hypothetical protein